MRARTNLDPSSQGVRFGSGLLSQLRELAWRRRMTVSELCRQVMADFARRQGEAPREVPGMVKLTGDPVGEALNAAYARDMRRREESRK